MLNHWKSAFTLLALSIAMLTFGAAFTSSAQAAAGYPQRLALRGEHGSARNILRVKARLEGAIDQLQHDQRDYGGHRERAIDLMQQARGELQAAIDYDVQHPH